MTVTASKQTVTNEAGEILREMYFITIGSAKGKKALQLNVGAKTYNTIKEFEKEEPKEGK